MHCPYPSWRYHRTLPARIVADPAEDDALGEGWANTPAAFAEDAPAPAEEAPSEDATRPTSDVSPVTDVALEAPLETQAPAPEKSSTRMGRRR